MTVELINAPEVMARFHGIARRAETPGEAMRPEIARLEEEERALFASWRGKFVRTGRSLRSLTEPGPDAIRLVGSSGLTFGTSVFYDRYLKTGHEGRHHVGPNAIFISSADAAATGVGQRVLSHIVNGAGL